MYLNVHSQYSLRYGTMSIEKLIKEATFGGITQMVLTDINNSTGIMEFMRACNKSGIKPIGGIEFRRNKQLLYIGVARDKEGMKELNDFLTEHNLEQKELPDKPKPFKNAVVIYPYADSIMSRSLGGNEYLGIRYDELHSLHGKDISHIKDKLLVLQPVFVASRLEYRLHEYLRGVDLNTLLTMIGPEDKCSSTDMFLQAGELEAKFSKYAFILDNTRKLMRYSP